MTHTCIPDEKARLGQILADGCERCAEHATQPWHSMDPATFGLLLARALAWERGAGTQPASATERAASENILDVLNAARAMFALSSRDEVVARLSVPS